MADLISEIKFKTARSGGKGGQHVNKVETMVEGSWDIEHSLLFNPEEKERITKALANRINANGLLQVRSQAGRSQLVNKGLVVKKMNALVTKALIIRKKRKATKPTGQSVEKRKEDKKKTSEIKKSRKKIQHDE